MDPSRFLNGFVMSQDESTNFIGAKREGPQ